MRTNHLESVKSWNRLARLRTVLGFLTLLCLILIGCGPEKPPVVETPPPTVTVSQPIVGPVEDQVPFEGRIVSKPKADIRARVRGHLTKVEFKDGDMVKKGDLLYEIDQGPAKAALAGAKAQEKAAEATLTFAKAEYNRERTLLPKGGSTREEVELRAAKQAVAQGEVLKAKAAVEEADLNLGYTHVTTPFDGKLSKTNVELGNLVNAGGSETLLTTLVTVDPIYVEFNVDERSLRRYQEIHFKDLKDNEQQLSVKDYKIPVRVALEGEDDYRHEGVVVFADNKVNPSTGTKLIRAQLSNKKGLLEDGMRARVRVPFTDPHEGMLVIERAIGSDQGKKYLYVVNAENIVERHDVTLGVYRDGLQEILQGVKPDEWVIVNGIQRVRDGIKVEPRRVPMPGTKQANESAQKNPTKK
jgi:RND family efflux transporter MFP subunit